MNCRRCVDCQRLVNSICEATGHEVKYPYKWRKKCNWFTKLRHISKAHRNKDGIWHVTKTYLEVHLTD